VRCVFCKRYSDRSSSVEHILPEALGNKDHTLPPGWVCDGCNNYFSREVEKPFLDTLYGRSSRFSMSVANKRGRIPVAKGLHLQSRTEVEISKGDGEISVGASSTRDEARWAASLRSEASGTLFIPTADIPDPDRITSRFIGKVGMEVLTQKCLHVPGWNDELVDKAELDQLRRYVRMGQHRITWPVHMRRLYAPDETFRSRAYGEHEVLHEWSILHVPSSAYYAVIAVFGIEYAINLGGPSVDGYTRWLEEHDNGSPLYPPEDPDH
jgi:hypothetical protein